MTPPAIAPALEERLAAFWGILSGGEELDVDEGLFVLREREEEGMTTGTLGLKPAIMVLRGVPDGLVRVPEMLESSRPSEPAGGG